MSLLTAILVAPLLGALLIACIPRNYRFVIRSVALLATLVSAVLAVKMFFAFEPAGTGFKFVQTIPWVQSLGLAFRVGVDGLNVGLVAMGALVAFAATCLSKEIRTREKEFYLLLLVMAGGILGAFVSLDLFCFYFFHELALVPTFIMIGVWGHGERKDYATFNITLYLSLGALIALAGLIALYLQMPAGLRTFDMAAMADYFDAHPISLANQKTIFPLLLFGFGILVSLWPFHTWAPLGYGSAPTATAMLHAGVLKKFGLYGLIRIALPLLPQGAKAWMHLLGLLCLGNILYCGWVAMRQRNLNLLIGNSSVAHMGMAFLGLASVNLLGVTGTVLIMVAHGFLAALSFGLSGYLRQQLGTLEMSEMGGLAKKMPFLGTVMIMAMLAGCGLPGFANFPGELLAMFGAWQFRWNFVAVAAWGALVVGGIYALRAIRSIWHGPLAARWEDSALLDARDSTGWSVFNSWRKLPFVLLVSCLLALGVYPQALVERVAPTVAHLLKCEPLEIRKPTPRKTTTPPVRPKRPYRSRIPTNSAAPVTISANPVPVPATNAIVPPVVPTNAVPATNPPVMPQIPVVTPTNATVPPVAPTNRVSVPAPVTNTVSRPVVPTNVVLATNLPVKPQVPVVSPTNSTVQPVAPTNRVSVPAPATNTVARPVVPTNAVPATNLPAKPQVPVVAPTNAAVPSTAPTNRVLAPMPATDAIAPPAPSTNQRLPAVIAPTK